DLVWRARVADSPWCRMAAVLPPRCCNRLAALPSELARGLSVPRLGQSKYAYARDPGRDGSRAVVPTRTLERTCAGVRGLGVVRFKSLAEDEEVVTEPSGGTGALQRRCRIPFTQIAIAHVGMRDVRFDFGRVGRFGFHAEFVVHAELGPVPHEL